MAGGSAWTIRLELLAPSHFDFEDAGDHRVDRLRELLSMTRGALFEPPGRALGVQFIVVGTPAVSDDGAAARRGEAVVADAMRRVGLEDWTVVSLEVNRADGDQGSPLG